MIFNHLGGLIPPANRPRDVNCRLVSGARNLHYSQQENDDSTNTSEGYEVKGETYSVAPNEKHKFCYMKDMTPEEAMFIKCFDSLSQGQPDRKEGVATLTLLLSWTRRRLAMRRDGRALR